MRACFRTNASGNGDVLLHAQQKHQQPLVAAQLFVFATATWQLGHCTIFLVRRAHLRSSRACTSAKPCSVLRCPKASNMTPRFETALLPKIRPSAHHNTTTTGSATTAQNADAPAAPAPAARDASNAPTHMHR